MQPKFFATAQHFRHWLAEHHDTAAELWVGFYKKGTGLPSLTWPESVDQALCYGWIDGIRKKLDERSYTIRFTSRRPQSIWSAVNIEKMAVLQEAGLVTSAGLAVFDERTVERSKVYAYERATVSLSEDYEQQIRADEKAWAFWQQLTPYVKKATTHWVASAKKEETRQRRLGILIESAANGRVVPQFRR